MATWGYCDPLFDSNGDGKTMCNERTKVRLRPDVGEEHKDTQKGNDEHEIYPTVAGGGIYGESCYYKKNE